MPTHSRPQWSKDGHTTLEILLSILMFTTAIAACIELFVSLSGRILVLLKAEHASHGPQHVIAEFSNAMNRASRCAIYPDRAAYQQYPALSGDRGNFAALWIDDGTLLAFELKENELRIVENPGSSTSRERLWAVGIEAPDSLCTIRNSTYILRFTAQTGTTRTSFQTGARPAVTR